jgi:hypothetical protein
MYFVYIFTKKNYYKIFNIHPKYEFAPAYVQVVRKQI